MMTSKEQTTDTILMVRPSLFRMNEETAVNNFFQEQADEPEKTIKKNASAEFDQIADKLRNAGAHVIIIEDKGEFDTPDSLFPNNVISFHESIAVLYPMFAENRRLERNLDYLKKLEELGFYFNKTIDFTKYEADNLFLEGTGVLILDREHRIAYCSMSPRADKTVLEDFCKTMNYQQCVFESTQKTPDGSTHSIYHTNVMMAIGKKFAVICTDTIRDEKQKSNVIQSLESSGKQVIDISETQTNHFCGNILELKSSTDGSPILAMSTNAYENFNKQQLDTLTKYGRIVHAPIPTIEKYGGGGVRCMIAEVFYNVVDNQ